jgi:putative PIN family toxin of toxin-antitoxin system
MHKVVLDSNIFISFLISHKPPISTILGLWQRGDLAVCYSPEIVDELERALKYPKIRKLISDSESESLIDAVKTLGILVIPSESVGVCRDKEDNKYLEVCQESGSNFLISGDNDLLALKEFKNVKIISPREFVSSFGG